MELMQDFGLMTGLVKGDCWVGVLQPPHKESLGFIVTEMFHMKLELGISPTAEILPQHILIN